MGFYMDGFKKIPKMKTGGSVRKYEEGGEVSSPKFHVYDRQTNERATKTEYANRSRASRAVDRLDNQYGGYRYYAKEVETPKTSARSGGGGSGGGGIELPQSMTPGGPQKPTYKRGGSAKPGLYANIAAKRERIKQGSGEKMRKPGDPGAPTSKAFKDSAKTAKK